MNADVEAIYSGIFNARKACLDVDPKALNDDDLDDLDNCRNCAQYVVSQINALLRAAKVTP